MMSDDAKEVMIYTDGACQPNPGRGGWGAIIIEDGKERILKGGEEQTTNNRMELMAALHAIQAVTPKERPIVLCTDSQYLKRGIEEWLPIWVARQWRRKGGSLANVDLWQALAKETHSRPVRWKWIQAHAHNFYNERVDKLAREAMKGYTKKKESSP